MSGVSRRSLLQGAGVAGALVAAPRPALATEGDLKIVDLRAESLVDPIGLEAEGVRLSWRIEADARGVMQARCAIEAASSKALLEAGKADLWKAGEVLADKAVDIAWAGRPLRSRDVVYWRVTVQDSRGIRVTSPTARFEMGLIEPSDWTAKWVAVESERDAADRAAGLRWMRGDRTRDGSPRAFRLSFDVAAAGPATLFSIANFDSEQWLDGQPVDRGPKSQHRFGTEPIAVTTHQLAAGRHVLAVEVQDATGFNSPKIHEIACAAMVRLEGGGKPVRITSEGMRTAVKPGGGWQQPTFDDARWAAATPSANQQQAWPRDGAHLLRREFSIDKPVMRARLYATALGAYVAEINGKRVGDALMSPESSDFREAVLYQTHDVTAHVRKGANAIGAMVGEGWYGSYHAPAGRYAFGDPPLRFLAQLEIEHPDGTRTTITTDDRWQQSSSPITQAEIYHGEDYDARLEQPGWSSPGLSAPDWRRAAIGKTPPCRLRAQVSPPLRAVERLRAKTIRSFPGDRHVVDFGQNFAGWVHLQAKAEAGHTATLRFAEILTPEGMIDQANLRAARAACTYVFRGDPAGESYEPRFSYFGFRYVEVSGFGRAPTPDEVEGVVVTSDLPRSGWLLVDNPIVQGLWHNGFWSQRSNFFGVPTDCPQRDERLGWTGDANVFWDAAAFNMDVGAFTRRFMGDMRDGQGPRGEFPDYAPAGWRDLQLGASPGWADAGIILPWTVWQRYGDTGVVDRNWPAMKHYLAFILEQNPDLVWRNGRGYDYGDWVALDAKEPGDETTPKALIATAMWKRSADAMADMAKGSGRQPEAERYRALSADIGRAFAAAFVKPDGSVGNGSQCGYILALRFGLVPEPQRAAATRLLVADIKRRGGLLSTGFLGTPFSLDALADRGETKLVYDLLLRTAFPSWGYMIAKGATTIWERWNADMVDAAMNSYNHYALGAVSGFVYRRIAGIDPLAPGFQRFRFAPVLDGRVTRGGARYESVLGRIETKWQQTPGGFEAELTVPANARAELLLPAAAPDRISEGGLPLAKAAGVTVLGQAGDRVTLEIGSGRYRFQTRS
ncbi:alpha-L-rhamnosidase [Sphingomonas sanxanigenens]|uniref:alpha-L-rhamnosidase n=1 Tax=Sphingomonas sanxanigenens DSM 19645 = NX02 TaxID=1123269 RepID=W0A670_9SPHN|nr:alpha-L-rhamnosidase [Sphingomonas sanxanigenens]AHE53459.1 hypothetical protein NX02_08680 [Sphingomonas sanxanigenens DSM 19645 = NX02]